MNDNCQAEKNQETILVVEDTAANRLFLTKLLSENGYEVRSASNGNLALRIVEQSRPPDLILLDIIMPDLDGYEVCRRLKASERSRNIPLIFISALHETMDKVTAFSLGGIDFITKPFEPEEVLVRVKTHLTLSRMQKQLEFQNTRLQQEIAERQQIQLALQKAHDELEIRVLERTKELELANQTKTAFFANVSHELRTPLNIILGATQLLLLDPTFSTKQRRNIDTIHDSSEYLLTIVNDILDISHMEIGALEFQTTDIHVENFLQKIINTFQNRAAQKRLSFVYEPFLPLPIGIYANEQRLRQILVNLLSNAVKFTEQGNVTFKVASETLKIASQPSPSNSSEVILHFEILDTGIGIAPHNLEKIFLPFEQVSNWKNKSAGVGLGLSITKKLVEAMGGELHVASSLGKGSRFRVDLTFPESLAWMKPVPLQSAHIVGYTGPRRKILVVDDHEENRCVMETFLSPLGFEIIEASNGQEGLEKVCNCQPDLVITDLVMPVMDGFEFMREIRKIPEFQHLPILADSASLVESHQSLPAIPLCNAFLLKPFNRQTLLERLGELLNLTWLYRQPQVANLTSKETTTSVAQLADEHLLTKFKGPSPAQAAQLLELTAVGDFFGVLDLIEQLEQDDAELHPWLAKIRFFAKQFDDVAIDELVQPYLSEMRPSTSVKLDTLVVPTISFSPNQAAFLLKLAMSGDFMGILKEVDKLETLDERLKPLITPIRQLAKNFQTDEVGELVKPYLVKE